MRVPGTGSSINPSSSAEECAGIHIRSSTQTCWSNTKRHSWKGVAHRRRRLPNTMKTFLRRLDAHNFFPLKQRILRFCPVLFFFRDKNLEKFFLLDYTLTFCINILPSFDFVHNIHLQKKTVASQNRLTEFFIHRKIFEIP
jgi:hypothetical protein